MADVQAAVCGLLKSGLSKQPDSGREDGPAVSVHTLTGDPVRLKPLATGRMLHCILLCVR